MRNSAARAQQRAKLALRSPGINGAVAQLGERLVCNQEATGSIPVSSTITPAISFQEELKTKGRQLRAISMLGANATTVSVSRFTQVTWRRILGWRKLLASSS